MPEQQKIDETIESIKSANRKKLSKIEQSATSLETEQDTAATETGSDDNDNVMSVLETQDDEVK
jgi:hypothetical protein